MDPVLQKVEGIYKSHYGKLVASMLYAFRDMEMEHAEDIVQESFTSAIIDWKKNGIPFNSLGWLYRVCKNRALNEIKRKQKTTELSAQEDVSIPDSRFSESILEDQQLKLLFACAHPDLSPKIQVVITLKYVINLKVEAIAKVLALSIDGIDKMLVRARRKLENEKIILELPSESALKSRLPIVHKVIYLLFNEGYRSSEGNEIIREELCEEALILTKLLIDCGLYNSETYSLYALMLFHAARFKSRFASNGDLLDLENQDRSLWNADLILMGNYYLKQSESNHLSGFHIEAYIAHIHCTAKSFDDTDWRLISQLYNKLLVDNANPFVELNYAIALYFSGEKQKAFNILYRLERQPYMKKYFLLNATIGRFYANDSNPKAFMYLEKAKHLTYSILEKKFIDNIISKLPGPGEG